MRGWRWVAIVVGGKPMDSVIVCKIRPAITLPLMHSAPLFDFGKQSRRETAVLPPLEYQRLQLPMRHHRKSSRFGIANALGWFYNEVENQPATIPDLIWVVNCTDHNQIGLQQSAQGSTENES